MQIVGLIIVLLIIISSGSFVMAAYTNHTYEEGLPITIFSISAVMFIAGLLNILKYGLFIVLGIVVVLYTAAIRKIVKQKSWHDFLKRFLTPGFVIYLLFVGFMLYYLPGMLFDRTDEFSHWGDVVRAMFDHDALSTNPSLHSLFASYPPGLAVFEYFVTKLSDLLLGTGFVEWHVYMAWQLMCFSVIMPFTKAVNLKNPFMIVAVAGILFQAPSWIYIWVYSAVYADPALGFFMGSGLAMILLTKERDWWYHSYIYGICFMLVLLKDVGMLFAGFVIIAYIIKEVFIQKGTIRTKVLLSAGGVLSLVLSKILWQISISVHNVSANFSKPYDFGTIIDVMLGKDDSYRSVVWKSYWKSFLTTGKELRGTEIPAVYLIIFGVLFLSSVLLCVWIRKKDVARWKSTILTTAVMWMCTIVYIFGLVCSYICKFSEGEALELASFTRYVNIIALCILMYQVCAWLGTTLDVFKMKKWYTGVLVIMALGMVVGSNFRACLSRSDVKASITMRQEYDEFARMVNEKIPQIVDTVYARGEQSEDLILRYVMRPRSIKRVEDMIGNGKHSGKYYVIDFESHSVEVVE